MLGQPDVRESRAADRGSRREVTLVALDVSAAEIDDCSDLGRMRREPAGELAQDCLDAHHRRRSQRELHLLDVSRERRP